MTLPEQYWIDRGTDLVGMDVLNRKDKARQASTYRAIVMEIEGRNFEDVLDIGCNVGAIEMFLRMQEFGPETAYAGIDTNPNAVAYCQALGLNVSLGSLRELPDCRFDCVVIKDVLEHLENLEPARNALVVATKVAILSFFLPPTHGMPVIGQTENGYYHNQYNESTLIGLADECGFDLEKRIETWETDGAMNRTYVFVRRAA